MKLHLLALPHTQLNERFLSCAYSQKIVKFCKMMGGRAEREIVLYGGDEARVDGIAENVVCVREEERRAWFGDGFDTVRSPFLWDSSLPYWRAYEERAVPALSERAEEGDLLLAIGGSCQVPIASRVPSLLPVEWGVGYEGIFSDRCAFESYAWMHHVYGLRRIVNGRAFDVVIPNFFDARDFLKPKSTSDGYLLYLGRVTQRKGPHVAGMIAKRMGRRLLVAGPGGEQARSHEKIVGDQFEIEAFHGLEYVGEVGKAARAELLAGADALVVPTLYIEPFGGVSVEAMMSGCPVVASDWGVFNETVVPEVGRRFRTLGQACRAVEECASLDRKAIREHAVARYSLEAVRPRFDAWFDQIATLWGEGWYA